VVAALALALELMLVVAAAVRLSFCSWQTSKPERIELLLTTVRISFSSFLLHKSLSRRLLIAYVFFCWEHCLF
jgi:hypothetical protein